MFSLQLREHLFLHLRPCLLHLLHI